MSIGDSITIEHTECIDNPEIGHVGFHALVAMSRNVNSLLQRLNNLSNHDLVLVEMPCFTQSAKSAVAIGLLWGMISQFDCIHIEPSALKKWSDSKSGDKKTKVKEKVLQFVNLNTNNDNIIDAVGLALMCFQKLRQLKYEYKTNQ